MRPNEAAVILERFNKYRRGDAPYPATAKAVGEAIDLAIKFLRVAEPSNTRKFHFGSVIYEVFPHEDGYRVVKKNSWTAFTRDSFIYDYCDEDDAKALRNNKDYIQKHIQAKHMAVALFKKDKG